MENKHYVYILHCNDDTLYTGYTNNLQRRLQLHEAGKAAKYTRGRGPFKVVFVEEHATKSSALKREYEIKRWNRQKKLRLISKDRINL